MSLIEEKAELLRKQREAELDEQTKAVLGQVEMGVLTRYTLADAIREGSTVSDQAYNWTDAEGGLCAMSAAVVAAKSRDYM